MAPPPAQFVKEWKLSSPQFNVRPVDVEGEADLGCLALPSRYLVNFGQLKLHVLISLVAEFVATCSFFLCEIEVLLFAHVSLYPDWYRPTSCSCINGVNLVVDLAEQHIPAYTRYVDLLVGRALQLLLVHLWQVVAV